MLYQKLTLRIYFLILTALQYCIAHCSDSYGGEHCKNYVPALPGRTPHCARPGLTYCEYPYDYPSHLIKDLIEKWKFDHSSIIAKESQEEYHSYYYTPSETTTQQPYTTYMYSYPYDISGGNGQQTTLKDDYFPYPAAKNNSRYEDSFKSKINNYENIQNNAPNSFQNTHPPLFYNRGREYYPNLQNNWWKRTGNLKSYFLTRKKRSFRAYFNSNNSTRRFKRQVLTSSQTLCQTRSNFIMPRAALNNKGDWKYIVNMPELDNNLAQLVKSEVCVSQQCSNICGLPNGVTSRCEQKYIQKRLVALEGSGSNLYNDIFWFPSCCLCTITNNN